MGFGLRIGFVLDFVLFHAILQISVWSLWGSSYPFQEHAQNIFSVPISGGTDMGNVMMSLVLYN
jgi:hypothetical protein